MDWQEFCVLLSGLMPETPLGRIVAIRSEEDRDILKGFTPEQRTVRSEWRSQKHCEQVAQMTEEEKLVAVKSIQKMFEKAFAEKR